MTEVENGGSSTAYTVKELVLQVGADVKGLGVKLDTFIQTHEARHSAEQVAAITLINDPTATAVGRRVVGELEDHEKRLVSLEFARSNETAIARERRAADTRTRWTVGVIAGVVGAALGGLGTLLAAFVK